MDYQILSISRLEIKAITMSFIDKKVSVRRAIAILAKSGIEVDDDEARVIGDLLYLMAKNYKKEREDETSKPPRRIRTLE